MKRLIVLLPLLLTGCFENNRVNSTPTEVINNQVAVPVLCRATVKKQSAGIDTAKTGMSLEEQNAMLRSSLAQQKERKWKKDFLLLEL
jgi:hypothetical protein